MKTKGCKYWKFFHAQSSTCLAGSCGRCQLILSMIVGINDYCYEGNLCRFSFFKRQQLRIKYFLKRLRLYVWQRWLEVKYGKAKK